MRLAYLASTATIGASAKLRVTWAGPPQPADFALDDRHPMKRDLAARRRDAADRAHHGVDAGRQAFAGVGPDRRPVESADDAGGPQLAQDVAERHRGDDVAAARIDEHDATQRLDRPRRI